MSQHDGEGAAITELILTIFLSNARIMRAGDAMVRDLGLTGVRWQILGAIKDTAKTVAQIARQYEFSRQGVLWAVQSLLQEGLVEYIANPDHKRAKLLVFTERGRTTYAEVTRRQQEWSSELSKVLSAAEVRSATKCIRKLGELMKLAPQGTVQDVELLDE